MPHGLLKYKLDNNEKSFWTDRGNHFQIRRLNVERLTIPEAVDWTGLKPYNLNDEKEYKYGNKYFKLPSLELPGEGTNQGNRFKKFNNKPQIADPSASESEHITIFPKFKSSGLFFSPHCNPIIVIKSLSS